MLGRCLCGAVQFEVTGTLPHLYQCHCSLCRRLSGSASDTATFVDADHFRWLSGEERITRFSLPSGYRSDFCSACGSTLPHAMRNGRQVWVPAGLLDRGGDSEVVAHLYVDSRAHWDVIGDDGHRYAEMPDIDTLDRQLQRDND